MPGEDRIWIVYCGQAGFVQTAGTLTHDIDQAHRWTSTEIEQMGMDEMPDRRAIVAPEVAEGLLGIPHRVPLTLALERVLAALQQKPEEE